MRNGLLGSVTALLAGTGLALAQTPPAAPRPYATAPLAIPAVASPASPVQPSAPYPPAFSGQGFPVQPGAGSSPAFSNPVYSPRALIGVPTALPAGDAPARPGTTAGGSAPVSDKPGARPEVAPFPASPCEPCCGVDEPLCGSGGRLYGRVDYLYWWTKGDRLPALLTTGPAGNLQTLTTAALNQPGTVVLFGNQDVNDDARSGGRTTVGFWLNPERSVGVEAGLFILDQTSSEFSTSSPDGGTVLARPYINADNIVAGIAPTLDVAAENALLVAYPGELGGVATATATNRLWGFETNGRINMSGNGCWRADLLLGFRYLNLRDNLTVTSATNPLGDSVVGILAPDAFGIPLRTVAGPILGQPSATLTVSDTFNTRNQYYGGQVGVNLEMNRGRMFVDFVGKLALGVMHQAVDISGSTALAQDGLPTIVAEGGVLAQSTNIGNRSRNEFGIVPEVGVNIGYQFGERLRAHIGYSVLYFRSDVIRPSSEIDRVVNPTLIPATSIGLLGTEARPQFSFRDVDFWAQGLTAGLQFSY